jgi:hypothetical protein
MVLPVDSQKNFDLYAEFNRLSWWQRGVSKCFSCIMTLFCQNYETSLRSWVGRFRKIESTDKSKASEVAKKVEQASAELKPKDAPASPAPASPSPGHAQRKAKRRKPKHIRLSTESVEKALPKEIVKTVEDAKEKALNECFFDESNLNSVRWIITSPGSIEEKITNLFDLFIKFHNYQISSPFGDELDLQIKIREFAEYFNTNVEIPKSNRPYPTDVAAKVTNVYDVPGGQLISYDTHNDGSCGFHAILGKPQNNKFVCDLKERSNICDRLLEGEQRKKLEYSLTNIFADFDRAPSDYKDALKRYYDEYHDGYRALSKEEQEKKKDGFIKDPRVIRSFIEKLRDTHVFLDQTELKMVARMSNVRLVLWQQGWYNDRDKLVRSETLGAEGEIVHVLFSHAHYEKARFVEDLKP